MLGVSSSGGASDDGSGSATTAMLNLAWMKAFTMACRGRCHMVRTVSAPLNSKSSEYSRVAK